MSHKDAGNYSKKRSSGDGPGNHVTRRIESLSRNAQITCFDAHGIAEDSKTAPLEIGEAIDLLEIKVIRCQLGLFGHGGKRRNIVSPANVVPNELRDRIMKDVEDNRISCKSLWDIAAERGIAKMEMTATCETLKIKICCCQLGTFG